MFGDGVDITFSEAQLQTAVFEPEPAVSPKPMLTVAEARSVSSGGVAFEEAGVGGAR